MDAREAAAILEAVGHPPAGIELRANGYWFGHCSCGYVSARRRTEAQAVGALVHHMIETAKDLVANGVSVPDVRLVTR